MENLTIKDIDFIDEMLLMRESSLVESAPTRDAMKAIIDGIYTLVPSEDVDEMRDKMYRDCCVAYERETIYIPEQIKRLRAKLLFMRDEILTTVR